MIKPDGFTNPLRLFDKRVQSLFFFLIFFILHHPISVNAYEIPTPPELSKLMLSKPTDWVGQPIKSIIIDTPYPFDTKHINRYLDISIDEPATYALIRDNIKRIYLTDFFETITVTGQKTDEGVMLTFICIKAYIIDSLEIKGGYSWLPWLGPTDINKRDIIEKIPLQRGGAFTPKKVKDSVDTIKKMFRDDGYWSCEVNVTSHFNNEERTVQVKITIDRKRPARITEFHIDKKRVDIDWIYAIFKYYRFNKWKFWKAMPGIVKHFYRFRTEKFNKDLQNTEEYYRKFGHYSSHCSIDHYDYDPETGEIVMYLVTDPGPQMQLDLKYDKHIWNFYWNLPWVSKQRFISSVFDFSPSDLFPVVKRGEVSQRNLDKGCENLEKLYREKGYENISVSVERKQLENIEGERIIYQIEEGQKIHVNKIRITGNHSFSPKEIKGIMRIKEKRRWPASMFSAISTTVKDEYNGIYVSDVFQQDIQTIKSFYITNGFRDCSISGKPFFLSENRVDLNIRIDEGIQTIITEIGIEGNEKISDEALRKVLVIKRGNPYYSPLIEQSKINLLLLYESQGFINNPQIESIEIVPTVSFHDYGSEARVLFAISEGYQIWFDRPLVKGIINTKNKVIAREIEFSKFDPYSLAKVLRTREELYKLGIFKRVTFEDLHLKHPYYSRTIVYTIEEKNSGSLDVGGGWNSIDGWRIFGSISDTNLLGRGQFIGLQANTNQDQTESDVEFFFREPYFANLPIESNTRVYRRFEEKDVYDLKATGGRIDFSRVFKYVYRATFEYRLEDIHSSFRQLVPVNYEDKLSHDDRIELLEDSPRRISSITPKFSIDTRNNPFIPSKGYLSNIQIEFARDFIGSESTFTKLSFQTSYYQPIDKNSVLVPRLRLGISKDLPIYERFRLGGETTMRGFGRDRVGPENKMGHKLFGNTLFLANLEYRFPLLWGFGGQIFYDVGNLWLEPIDKIEDFSLVHCIGYGIRYDFSFGPLRIDAGYDVNKNGIGNVEWTFTIGHPF